MPHEYMGPFVQVACICQTVLPGADGLLSLIRISDRIQVVGQTPEMHPQSLQHYSLVILLKSGTLRETYQIKIQVVTPAGGMLPPFEVPALFEGEDRGVAIVMPLLFSVRETGLHWIDVRLGDQLLSRIPLRILYSRIQLPPGMSQIPPPAGQ